MDKFCIFAPVLRVKNTRSNTRTSLTTSTPLIMDKIKLTPKQRKMLERMRYLASYRLGSFYR